MIRNVRKSITAVAFGLFTVAALADSGAFFRAIKQDNDVAMRNHAFGRGAAIYEAVGATRTFPTPPSKPTCTRTSCPCFNTFCTLPLFSNSGCMVD